MWFKFIGKNLPPGNSANRYGAFANLKGRGYASPADRLATLGKNPDVVFALDEFGNIKGAIRTPYVDVLRPTYHRDGKATPFENNLLKQLYPTHEHYVREVTKRTDELLANRWITEFDGKTIKEQAEQAYVP